MEPPFDERLRLIDAAELRKLVPLSGAQIRRMEADSRFPRRIKIGERRVAWRLSEVLDWIDERAAERDK